MFGVDSVGLHYYIFSTLNKHKTQIKVYFENYFFSSNYEMIPSYAGFNT